LLRYEYPSRNGLDIEAILNDLHVSKVNASISLSCDSRIDVKLGDPLTGYDAEATGLHRPRAMDKELKSLFLVYFSILQLKNPQV
jgi:hypothetical protein